MRRFTEDEFDRRYLVKRTIARTFLKRAAEIDDPRRAHKFAQQAIEILSFLPDKERCKVICCVHCGGRTCSRKIDWHNFYGRPVMGRAHPFRCEDCGVLWRPVVRFEVYEGKL